MSNHGAWSKTIFGISLVVGRWTIVHNYLNTHWRKTQVEKGKIYINVHERHYNVCYLFTGKEFVYQEKCTGEEVQLAVPLYTEEIGKEKHELTQLLVDLLFDLNGHGYNTVALPVKTFNTWPSTKLTKIMLVALKEYLQELDQNNIQKIYVCSTDPEVCQRAISAMEYAIPDLQRVGFTAGIFNT